MKAQGRILLMALLAWFLATSVRAQVLHVSGNVYKTMRSMDGNKRLNRMPLTVPVYVFDNRRDAKRQAEAYRQAKDRGQGTVNVTSNAIVTPDYEGHFETDISADGALLAISEGELRLVSIGKELHYDIVFDGSTGGILLDNATVVGKRVGAAITEMSPIDDGPNLHWDVTATLPDGYAGNHSRLIFQPAVIDCQEEDTVRYLEPLVYEGGRYHANQVRRKSFDYARNDSLQAYHVSDAPLGDGPFTFRWRVTYAKPNPLKSYKWVSVLQLEDYTHVYFSNNTKSGTCNTRKPWKLLDVSMARKPIQLTPAYYEQARAQLRQIPRDLRLTFEVGSDELTADSANQINLDHLVRELRSYGRTLINFTVRGTASPEGNLAFNTKLARSRAQRALGLIGRHLGSAGLEVREPLVYTWHDVADSLRARGLTAEADRLAESLQNNRPNVAKEMRAEVKAIDDILQNMRLMHCTYTIRQNKVLDADEALWAYYNDPAYREGGTAVFSNGDYYHLFTQIKDTAELRRLTSRAWEDNKARLSMKYSPFAAYLANRVACYAIEADSVDTSILAPFIDLGGKLEAERQVSFDNSYRYTVNRRELVANQAIMYFKQMRLGEAYRLASMLPDTDDYRDIKMFTDLEALFFKAGKTPEEQRRATAALRYVMASSPENNAILSFELAPELGKTMADVEPLVDSLPDSNASKWYMKGVIEAGKPEASDEEFMELARKYGVDVALRMTDNSNPAFLAYFQHSFDMNPEYKKHYLTDANIADETRKKYPYDPKKADEYRQKFDDLMVAAGKKEATPEGEETDVRPDGGARNNGQEEK